MKTEPLADDLERTMRSLKARDDFRDDRSVWERLTGPPRFAWQIGWLTVDSRLCAFVHALAWPPGLLAKTEQHLAARYDVRRVERGVLDRRRQHTFMVALISGRRDISA